MNVYELNNYNNLTIFMNIDKKKEKDEIESQSAFKCFLEANFWLFGFASTSI